MLGYVRVSGTPRGWDAAGLEEAGKPRGIWTSGGIRTSGEFGRRGNSDVTGRRGGRRGRLREPRGDRGDAGGHRGYTVLVPRTCSTFIFQFGTSFRIA